MKGLICPHCNEEPMEFYRHSVGTVVGMEVYDPATDNVGFTHCDVHSTFWVGDPWKCGNCDKEVGVSWPDKLDVEDCDV